ncbi:putative membrane-associated kinase regulator 4 [Sesamum alatum]|uniref:Membrane-associated kinase regulator 4 n=1 Tax=Sesamum alatum TaxID=300844 RepID=A0AAE2CKD8_9LAMI|nr:putative membrane-associated kinase regulator 4 [Sesamum alatum]
MEANLHSSYSEAEAAEEEDYINMEVDSSLASTIFRRHSSTKEFEFQSFSSSSEKDHTTTSPADELFYMGKLLPLHLPPRLEMVHNILQNSASFHSKSKPFEEDESFGQSPLFMTPTANTPFESCTVSPAESCNVSRELCPDEYFLDYQEKKSWTKKLKLIKQSSSIGSKLKWGYLKSLFTKSSGCSDDCCAAGERPLPKAKQRANGYSKSVEPFGKINYDKDSNFVEEHRRGGSHRRSFSGAFKRLSKPKTSAISASNSSSDNCNRQCFKRSSSASSELENPIQAAIAHCKRSQQQLYSRQMANELGFCSVSASSRVIYDEQERPGLCRG